jgi:hypothetical protein
LPNPGELVLLAKKGLVPGGAIVASVPNVAHWFVRLDLLRGRFEYQDCGIMDATHLRWFTRNTLHKFFENLGLRVTDHLYTLNTGMGEYNRCRPWKWFPQTMRYRILRQLLKSYPTLFGCQHVVRASLQSTLKPEILSHHASNVFQDPDEARKSTNSHSGGDVIRAIAFYLPQFHPIPENDEWWGKGFTEWTNVVKTRPLFRGHHQPHLPADLGFYDLRLPEARAAQAELAASYGIHGFCYYHYWFNGRRLLGRPLDEILASGQPDFPFCLCWANESWTRGWSGEDQDVLISQTYTPDDELVHARWLAKTFADRRYLRKDGRAVFLVYRPGSLPEPRRLIETLRAACNKNGDKEPYLIGVDARCVGRDLRNDGFDATLAFEPQLGALPGAFDDAFNLRKLLRNLRLGVISGKLKVYDYMEARQRMLSLVRPFPTIPCVLVGWDNTPRRGANGLIVVNSSPQAFGSALEAEIAKLRTSGEDDPLLFINAWNEWAEGNHLEPCQTSGFQHLEVIRKALGINDRVTYSRSEMRSQGTARSTLKPEML